MHALDLAICRCYSDSGQANLTFSAAACCHIYIASRYWLERKHDQAQPVICLVVLYISALRYCSFTQTYLSCGNV